MICRLLNREFRYVFRSALRYLDQSVSSAMGCFVACFRVRDDRSSLSHSINPRQTEPVVVTNSNRLSALFIAEEKEESWSSQSKNQDLESPAIDKELKEEAKFLKACGTLPETPAEIRKASQKLKGDEDSEPSKFNSWLPNASIKKLQTEIQNQQPHTPIKLPENWGKGSTSLEQTPSSFVSNVPTEGGDMEGGDNAAKVTDTPSLSNVPFKNKSVRFECEVDSSPSKDSSGNLSHYSKKYETNGIQSASKPSPNPTPLKLSEDMQTPGTVFPSNIRSAANGNIQIRSQYVYPVSNTDEDFSQWKVLKDESHQPQDKQQESSAFESATPMTEARTKSASPNQKDKNVVSSTSDDNDDTLAGAAPRNPYFGRTPGDRPIIGMVAAHWNENEVNQISPKWWDGNGIPNSTNKYKEDQKVSWHATPFEERLEKALSEESFISQKKIIQKPITFDDAEETDTAMSRLRPSSNSKSVVSF